LLDGRDSEIRYTGVVTFTWDPKKAEANLRKHRVDFREASTVYEDTESVAFPDVEHSVGERRFLIIGVSARHRVLVVAYIEVSTSVIRIISAREATRHERRFYEDTTSTGE
jgi:uncharacterized DUF497 family protein